MDWKQKERAQPFREQVKGQIIRFLEKQEGSDNFKQKIPSLGLALEKRLFEEAITQAEYSDQSTLESRIKKAAHWIKQGHYKPDPPVAPPIPAATYPSFHPGRTVKDPLKHKILPQLVPVAAINPSFVVRTTASQIKREAVSAPAVPPRPKKRPRTESPPNVQFSPPRPKVEPSIPSRQVQSPAQNAETSKKIVKQQRLRLLLLGHASTCKSSPCVDPSYAKYCETTKALWAHIVDCKDQQCARAHCKSSRYLLAHYYKCQDEECPVCSHFKDHRSLFPSRPFLKRPEIKTSASFLASFTKAELVQHCEMLRKQFCASASPMKIRQLVLPLLKAMADDPNGGFFLHPVDPVKLQAPGYFDMIRHPMDLGTVRQNLTKLQYNTFEQFEKDVTLTFRNAMKYNPPTHIVHRAALQLLNEFKRNFNEVKSRSARELGDGKEIRCRICEGSSLRFQPPPMQCSGPCKQKIRRNSYYYICTSTRMFFCQACFNSTKEEAICVKESFYVLKADLTKKKNDQEKEEEWVQCDECGMWCHHICALYNPRLDECYKRSTKSLEGLPMLCPFCQSRLVTDDEPPKPVNPLPRPHGMSDVPRCHMSDFIEKRIVEYIEQVWPEIPPEVQRLGKPVFSVRVVSSFDTRCTVRKWFQERYCGGFKCRPGAATPVPTDDDNRFAVSLGYRSKCVILCQTLDNVETILFGMYVQEYGSKCPGKNRRRVYISYLDSVKYMTPPQVRTGVYHEVLLGYLEWVKMRGFESAFLWACPPLKGDDFILYCHPENQVWALRGVFSYSFDQKTPKSDRLRQWYLRMLQVALERDVAVEVGLLFNEFFEEAAPPLLQNTGTPRPSPVPGSDPTATAVSRDGPRFPVDLLSYSPMLKVPYFDGDYWVGQAEEFLWEWQSEKVKRSQKSGRSAGLGKGSHRIAASLLEPPHAQVRTVKKGESAEQPVDPLYSKLRDSIKSMKNDFLVIHLADQCAGCHQYLIGQGGYRCLECHNAATQYFHDKLLEKGSSSGGVRASKSSKKGRNKKGVKGKKARKSGAVSRGRTDKKDERSIHRLHGVPRAYSLCENCYVIQCKLSPEKRHPCNSNEVHVLHRAHQPAPYPLGDDLVLQHGVDTTDPDPVRRSIFDTRGGFLTLCQLNYYQFDQLRRAKYSSIMLQYFVHNQMIDPFIHRCSECEKVILDVRWRCEQCELFELCTTCHDSATHQHALKPLLIDDQDPRETEQQVVLLAHCVRCDTPTCVQCSHGPGRKVQEWKKHLQHKSCIGANKGCPLCLRWWFLVELHARSCTCSGDSCPVPKCRYYRNRQQNVVNSEDKVQAARARQQQLSEKKFHSDKKAKVMPSSTAPPSLAGLSGLQNFGSGKSSPSAFSAFDKSARPPPLSVSSPTGKEAPPVAAGKTTPGATDADS